MLLVAWQHLSVEINVCVVKGNARAGGVYLLFIWKYGGHFLYKQEKVRGRHGAAFQGNRAVHRH